MSDPTPQPKKGPRWALIGGIAALVLVAAVLLLYRFALNELRTRVQAALGPQSEVGEINVSWNALVIEGLRIKSPAGWPAKETLVAGRVTIVPKLLDVFSGKLRIASVTIDAATLSVLRAANGKLRLLPSLTEKPAGLGGKTSAAPSAALAVSIDLIELRDSRLQFFDAAIASPPLQLSLDAVNGKLTNLNIPSLKGKSGLQLEAKVAGASRSGRVAVKGEMEFATKDSDLNVQIRDMDVAALEPYLLRAAETGVSQGLLDLDLRASVAAQRINAPGALVLRDLVLKDGGGFGATFMGMPRSTFIDMLRQKDGRIDVPFRIEGSLDDPGFSLHSAFKARLGIAAAGALGISIKSLAEELKGKGSAQEKIEATVDALKRLMGR